MQARILRSAAAAATAFAIFLVVGASPASATALYSGAAKLGAGTELKWSELTSVYFAGLNESPIVTCAASNLDWTTGNAGGASSTVSGAVGIKGMSFSSCTSTVTVVEGGELEIHHIAGSQNVTLTARNFDIVIHVFGVQCGYTAGSGTDLEKIIGSSSSTASVSIHAETAKKTGGFLCPANVLFIAGYDVTQPDPMHVTAS